MEKKVVIIGAGIAGLSAGCYARMNGYDVEIHEAHDLPGGLCTSWKRGDYVVDGCIHWLTDSRPGSGYYRIWEELGAVQSRRMFYHDVFSSVVAREGRTLHWYTDVNRLGVNMLKGNWRPSDIQALMAMTTVSVIPLLVLFFVAQRYFVQGIVITGVKG